MKRNACQKCVFAVRDDNPHCGLRGFRSDFNVEWCESENDKVPNGYELQEDGYFSWVHKKEGYPKTYEECCKVLSIPLYYNLRYHTYERGYGEFATSNELLSLQDKLNLLGKLIICRDAYWKIAGEEMGLGKSWEPSGNEDCFVISRFCDEVFLFESAGDAEPFEFPTREMRDAFYENFKELINECKELL